MNLQTRTLSRLTVVCIGLFYCLLATAAKAPSPTQQIEQLRQQVQDLELRVQQLEHPRHADIAPTQSAATPAVVPPPSIPTPAAASAATTATPVTAVDPALQSLGRLKEAWKGIDTGMSNAQIRTRLGEPARILTIDGKTVWYYSYPGVGNGSVMFSTANKVLGWQNPPFGLW